MVHANALPLKNEVAPKIRLLPSESKLGAWRSGVLGKFPLQVGLGTSIVSPMQRRFRAWLMFLVLGLVLPLAGSPLHYCLCAKLLMAPGMECSHCADVCDGDCEHDCPAPTDHQDCCVSLDLLPDALPQGDLVMPTPPVLDIPPLGLVIASAPQVPVTAISPPPHDHGPPPGSPHYLRFCSMLL